MGDIAAVRIDNAKDRFFKECERLSIAPSVHSLIVSIEAQELYHYCKGELIKCYTVSTSENKPSCVQGSFGTPLGMHRIGEKIGDGVELGMVFKQRKVIGKKYWECEQSMKEERLVTTRILWLEGLEPGLNRGEGVDSYERFIYIHGTNREHLLGSPVTLGCITLSNEDVIDLYESVPCGSLVWICKST